MVDPFSIWFSTMDSARAAYSSGRPIGRGKAASRVKMEQDPEIDQFRAEVLFGHPYLHHERLVAALEKATA
jgi:hypothetical protein